MYIVYCQNKPKSEHIVSEYIDTFFEVSAKEGGGGSVLNLCLLIEGKQLQSSPNLLILFHF